MPPGPTVRRNETMHTSTTPPCRGSLTGSSRRGGRARDDPNPAAEPNRIRADARGPSTRAGRARRRTERWASSSSWSSVARGGARVLRTEVRRQLGRRRRCDLCRTRGARPAQCQRRIRRDAAATRPGRAARRASTPSRARSRPAGSRSANRRRGPRSRRRSRARARSRSTCAARTAPPSPRNGRCTSCRRRSRRAASTPSAARARSRAARPRSRRSTCRWARTACTRRRRG